MAVHTCTAHTISVQCVAKDNDHAFSPLPRAMLPLLSLPPSLPASALALVWRANGKATKEQAVLHSAGVLLGIGMVVELGGTAMHAVGGPVVSTVGGAHPD